MSSPVNDRKIVLELCGHKFYEEGVSVKGDRIHLTCAPGCCTTPFHCELTMHKTHYDRLIKTGEINHG